MAGEFLREAAVLIGVFVPLDLMMVENQRLTLSVFLGTLAVVGTFWTVGAYLGLEADE